MTLNGHGSTTDGGKVSYSWTYIPLKNYDIDITEADSPNAMFNAPYIIDDVHNGHIERSITLKFQLVVSDDKGRLSNPSQVSIKVKRVQRALIFQGGVAVGAYEAGVFQALVEKIGEEQRKRGLEKRPLFDIVAGASIGAWNAAVVVSNASKSWEHSARELGFGEIRNAPELVDPISHFW